MRILAVDSSHLKASVSVFEYRGKEDVRLLSGLSASAAVSASESLLPLIDAALEAAGLEIHELDALAVGVGPGSFTGIRIGLSTVKTLAQALNKPIIEVSSLMALALSTEGLGIGRIVAMANAYQGQVFVGWEEAPGQWREDAQVAAQWVKNQILDSRLHPSFLLVGPGADLYKDAVEAIIGQEGSQSGEASRIEFKPHVTLAPYGLAQAVRHKILHTGPQAFSKYLEVKANYIRPSQAALNLEKHQKGLVSDENSRKLIK